MRLVTTLEELGSLDGGALKWRRCLEAIERAPRLPRDVAGSVGDSVTFWREAGPEHDEPGLTAHHRYLEVVHVLSGRLLVEHAPVSVLEQTEAYRDTTDRMTLAGHGTVTALGAGQTVVVGRHEAVRRLRAPGCEVVTAHVTVEGGGSHDDR